MTDFCYTYRYDPEYEEFLITADENMSFFECIVPRWYTKKPGVKRISLDIKGICAMCNKFNLITCDMYCQLELQVAISISLIKSFLHYVHMCVPFFNKYCGF